MTTATGHTEAIRASTVIGTDVKDTNGDSIGEIEDIVLDKLSNNIKFVIVSFGGFLGIGEKYHPLPWGVLKYSEEEDAYVVTLSKEKLKAAPSDSIEALTRNDGNDYRDRVYSYYDHPRYW
jgi:sporulation protein YlmC with PRC-barrel domain